MIACKNETIDNAFDFDIETMDKESNKFYLIGTIRYRLKSRLEKKLQRKYDGHYKDSLFGPVISTISNETLKEYSAGEIYNYKRDEVEQKLREKVRTTFAQYDIELTKFSIWSVKLPDSLMHRLEKEHIERLNSKKPEDKN